MTMLSVQACAALASVQSERVMGDFSVRCEVPSVQIMERRRCAGTTVFGINVSSTNCAIAPFW
jgi:hypothetical protein